ncbi:Protein LONGIFOLIA 2 [Zea mays]|uniref:Protein LONGIFOLIA 2 n=1 Tax=Zea mays TaxID=4577 RepID=A0A1D6ELK7_MAIZE|nr:Protein LONGIFOLIA 2 [Zea mays]
MPAKYLGPGALAEDRRQDLHRQVGCVTGILQAFDRRHPLASSSHKRLLPPTGHAVSSNPSKEGDCTRYSPQIVLENSSKTWADSQRAPATELSQTSYSSSPSSSFSSVDDNKSTQQDLSSTDRMLFPERPFKSSPKLKSYFDSDTGLDYPDDAPTKSKDMPIVQSSLPTLGIRNLVKDSIYMDSRELSVRICTKEVTDHPSNCGDQPRELNGPPRDSTQEKSKGLVDINESLRVLAKLREASWTPAESVHHARLSYDAPRFSYDGKEAASKLREVPRLSLDIKESHLRNGEIDSRLNPSLSSTDRSSNTVIGSNAAFEIQQKQPACKRLPSVVAKLMGLEELPEHNQSIASSHACKTVQGSKQEAMFNPLSISSHNEHALRQQRNHDSTVRNLPNSKFPVETAPWKQQERIILPRKLPKGSKGAHGREQPAASVISDIEKRLKDLDFRQSYKDLRALKHILDSMQAKGLLENKNREEISMPKLSDGNHNGQEIASVNMRVNSNTNNVCMPEESNAESSFKSPIVIMKPSKCANLFNEVDSSVFPLGGSSDPPQQQTSNSTYRRKASTRNRTAKEQHAKFSSKVPTSQPLVSYDRRSYGRNDDSSNNQKSSSLLVTESSSRRQQLPRDSSISMKKNKHSTTPRLQQRKLGSERRARPPIPCAESNKSQNQSGDRNNAETVSPRSKFRRKLLCPQEGDDDMPSGLNNRTRSLNQHGNDMSTRSDGSITVASELDIISNDRSTEVDIPNFDQGIGTPSGRNPQRVETSYDASKDVPSVDPSAGISERPSPVSVLDSSFDHEDLFPSSRNPNSLAVALSKQHLN